MRTILKGIGFVLILFGMSMGNSEILTLPLVLMASGMALMAFGEKGGSDV